MGRLVAFSGAEDSQSAWAKGVPAQRFFQSCVLGLAVLTMSAYAASGLVFGHLPVFVLEGFVTLSGLAAVLGAVGTAALAAAWGAHLVQRHWSDASAASCTQFRKSVYWLAGLGWAAALLIALSVEAGMKFLDIPAGLAPDADWMLLPLPWIWQHFLPFTDDEVVSRLVVVGGVALAVAFPFFKWSDYPKPGLMLSGVTVCMAGAWFLGDASYHYAAARGMAGVASPELAAELRANPGFYNAWNFMGWLGGLAALALGTLMTAGLVWVPNEAIKQH